MYTKLKREKVRYFCIQNFKTFLKESNLHGLRFIGDDTITIWERLFFLCAFGVALISTGNLVSYMYSKWSLTPIIIATNPYPTSIGSVPFPAITLCNMNQLSRKRVLKYSKDSYQSALIEMACFEQIRDGNDIPPNYINNNLSYSDFLIEHSQTCPDMLLNCRFNSIQYNCSDLFRNYLTDEGVCCVFNLVDGFYRYKPPHNVENMYKHYSGAVPVDWSPEEGYQKELPANFFPRTSDGIGVTMGLSLIIDADVDDYYCSSTNGPGFKIDLHNPIDAPRVKDNGLTISPGQDTRFRITAHSSSALPSTRGFSRKVRNCLFNDESKLVYYKYYTRKNCEKECLAVFLYSNCRCIPYNYPLVFLNATTCGAPESFCIDESLKAWLLSNSSVICLQNCPKSCFDLTYSAAPFVAPLIQNDYIIQNAKNLQNFSREYIRNNIAVVNIFYHKYVFYGDVRNVYVGFQEFLSNIGGILGLFLGFSFISVVELFYYGIMRPISCWLHQSNENQSKQLVPTVQFPEENSNAVWYSHELYPTQRKNKQNTWKIYQDYKKTSLQNELKEINEWKDLKKLENFK